MFYHSYTSVSHSSVYNVCNYPLVEPCLDTISHKKSRSRRRSHPLLSSDRSSEKESSSVAVPGKDECVVLHHYSHMVIFCIECLYISGSL